MKEKILQSSMHPPSPILVLLILFVVGVISGCDGSGSSTPNYFVGVEGLKLEFLKSNPTSVFENDPFATYMFLRNIGSYDIPNATPGRMSITYDDYYLTLDRINISTRKLALHGKSVSYPQGEEEYYEFLFKVNELPTLRDTVKTNINYIMCYPYRSELSVVTCVDTRISGNDETPQVCRAAEWSSDEGQGGPIAITKIIPEMRTSQENFIQPQYRIYVENKAAGYPILRKGNEDVCKSITINKTATTINKVSVKAKLSDKLLVCNPPELRLADGSENFFRCYLENSEIKRTTRNYPAILTLRVDYGYVEVIPQEIEIKRNEEFTDSPLGCGYYQKLVNGSCMELCEFCSLPQNAGAAECKRNRDPKFSFEEGFSCTCGVAKCTTLSKTGGCFFGYCTNSYCCKTNECDSKTNGTQCGDNHVCIDKKCSAKSECEYYRGTEGFACMKNDMCDQGSIVTGWCPGVDNNVCCKKQVASVCKDSWGVNLDDGTPCNNNHVCILGVCSTKTRCEHTFPGSRCIARAACTVASKQHEGSLCPLELTSTVCCEQ